MCFKYEMLFSQFWQMNKLNKLDNVAKGAIFKKGGILETFSKHPPALVGIGDRVYLTLYLIISCFMLQLNSAKHAAI